MAQFQGIHHKTKFVFIYAACAGCEGHSIVEKPQKNAVPAVWCSSPSGKATAYLNANKVNVVNFLPKSPDLYIIENIWDELNHRVRRTEAIPTTLNKLRAKILYEWNKLPQNYVQRYVTSMRRRCLAVVNIAGRHTHY